ncbi:unnamed protein product [Porites evermanni]|uniref:Uncharacterized protein n=1 Tax=Porites evermanni TaxID=104178 RepID=A0ABN8RB13_9CNID|nr:unnamed protein product [Porites evermanni]
MAADQETSAKTKVICDKLGEIELECFEIRKSTSDLKELELLDKVQDKCRSCGHLLEKWKDAAEKEEVLGMILQQYSQAVLDLTYVIECRLVNDDFPQDRSKEEIGHVIGRLDQPQQLVKETFGQEDQAIQVLGTDMVECLYWRRGALCYMYCHTVFNNAPRVQLSEWDFIQCAESGVVYLESMLSVRSPLVVDEYENTKDSEMVKFLQEGVFSDTHLLALMYAGELCYWHWQITKEEKDATLRKFDSVASGRKFLKKFVNIVKGNLQGQQGWDCSRAEQLLTEFPVS